MFMETEKATYDPDLPHAYMPGRSPNECELCGRPRKEDLHQVQLQRQQASEDQLVRELGS